MKKIAAIMLIIAVSFSAFAALSVRSLANSLALEWDEVEDVVWYDIYIDDGFIARLDSSQLSFTVENLEGNREYKVSWAARDGENNNLDVSIQKCRTLSWDGEYRWVNTSDDDNRGKMKTLTMRVKSAYNPEYGQYPEIYVLRDGKEYRFFPIFNPGEEKGSWIEWDDDSYYAESYRKCAELINRSPVNPSRWKLNSMRISPSEVFFSVSSKAFGFTADTDSSIRFFYNDEGERCLEYRMDGDSLFMKIAFMNPVDGSPVYVLEEVK